VTPSFAVNELLLPRTDAGAGVQVIAVVLLATVVAVSVRQERSLVLLTFGIATVVLGLMGMRAIH
jgi:hypothetical protein